ncbi:glycosyltransferase family 4 protein [Halobellus inordinatus]|uniref:glycosyltransferase family 4 protein n=1 Tax=Halobellus inordinatus TaxID=1126236 RepID=UPI002114BB74|nr:glycosyltransferase [Halobellus ramosii]
MTRLFGFLNAYTDSITGGDVWFIEVLKRLPATADLTVVTSALGRETCLERGLDRADYLITTSESEVNDIYSLYLKRIRAAIRLDLDTDPEDILFASSVFLPDVVPLLNSSGRRCAIYHMQTPGPLAGLRPGFDLDLSPSQYVARTANWVNEAISTRLLRRVADLMLVLPTTRGDLLNAGFPADMITTTLNGVDLNLIEDIEPANEQYDACWVGRMHPQKGVHDLLSIWDRVVADLPDAQLALIGRGTESLADDVARAGLSHNVDLLGYLSETEKFATLKASRAFILPSYYESFGIVAMEAAACGLPIFAYDLPDLRTIYGNRLVYVPRGDTQTLARRLSSTLDSPEQLAQLAVNREFVSRFDWDHIAENLNATLLPDHLTKRGKSDG